MYTDHLFDSGQTSKISRGSIICFPHCIYTHSLATLLGTPCLYRIGRPFAFRTSLILLGIDSTRFWKHSSEILVHIDMIAASPWCESPVPPHPKGALLDWDLVTVEAIWVKWTHCHVIVMFKKPVWDDLSFVTWCIILLEVAVRRCVHCSHKGKDMVSNNTQVGCGV